MRNIFYLSLIFVLGLSFTIVTHAQTVPVAPYLVPDPSMSHKNNPRYYFDGNSYDGVAFDKEHLVYGMFPDNDAVKKALENDKYVLFSASRLEIVGKIFYNETGQGKYRKIMVTENSKFFVGYPNGVLRMYLYGCTYAVKGDHFTANRVRPVPDVVLPPPPPAPTPQQVPLPAPPLPTPQPAPYVAPVAPPVVQGPWDGEVKYFCPVREEVVIDPKTKTSSVKWYSNSDSITVLVTEKYSYTEYVRKWNLTYENLRSNCAIVIAKSSCKDCLLEKKVTNVITQADTDIPDKNYQRPVTPTPSANYDSRYYEEVSVSSEKKSGGLGKGIIFGLGVLTGIAADEAYRWFRNRQSGQYQRFPQGYRNDQWLPADNYAPYGDRLDTGAEAFCPPLCQCDPSTGRILVDNRGGGRNRNGFSNDPMIQIFGKN